MGRYDVNLEMQDILRSIQARQDARQRQIDLQEARRQRAKDAIEDEHSFLSERSIIVRDPQRFANLRMQQQQAMKIAERRQRIMMTDVTEKIKVTQARYADRMKQAKVARKKVSQKERPIDLLVDIFNCIPKLFSATLKRIGKVFQKPSNELIFIDDETQPTG